MRMTYTNDVIPAPVPPRQLISINISTRWLIYSSFMWNIFIDLKGTFYGHLQPVYSNQLTLNIGVVISRLFLIVVHTLQQIVNWIFTLSYLLNYHLPLNAKIILFSWFPSAIHKTQDNKIQRFIHKSVHYKDFSLVLCSQMYSIS